MIITENRVHVISLKIFEAVHIKSIAKIFQQEYNIAIKNKNHLKIKDENISLNFYIKCFEPVSFQSESDAIFSDNSKIYTKRIHSIEMTFKQGDEKNIRIVLQHGESEGIEKDGNSYLEVSGKNEIWVNGTLGKLEDYLKSVPEQTRGILNYDNLLFFGSCAIGGYLTTIVISLDSCRDDANYCLKNLYKTDGILWLIFLLGILSFIPGIFLGVFIDSQVKKIKNNAYPSIELLIGPEHLLVSKKKKKQLNFLWTMITLPFIVSIVCNIITSFIH
ncbi:MAG TPA: hypothetical protein VKG26_03305 [Bacteroidia bacterium]|nr:hypothetical protein [Bacteroidia bacterium]